MALPQRKSQEAKARKALWMRFLVWLTVFLTLLVVTGQNPGLVPEPQLLLRLLGVGVLVFGGLLLLGHQHGS